MEDIFAMVPGTLTCARLIFALHIRDAIILEVISIQSFFLLIFTALLPYCFFKESCISFFIEIFCIATTCLQP